MKARSSDGDLADLPGARPVVSGMPRDPLDRHVDPAVRRAIEARYLDPIAATGSFREILKDPAFLDTPIGHPALYADHGGTHARDVARQILHVLDNVHGQLIPRRSPARLAWMKAYGVLLALLHDIGMVDASPEGRSVHPEWAAREALSARFGDVLAAIRATDHAGFARRVDEAARGGLLRGTPSDTALREMLAMSFCHSKRKVPVAILNDDRRLRQAMQAAVAGAPGAATGFAWLDPDSASGRDLVDDVVDVLRALRCADALRQRGTVLKTSGQYEVFIDQQSGNAVYAFRPDAEHLYLLEVHDPIAVGEANLSSCQLEADGDLRVSFHHGHFPDPGAAARVARCAALVLQSIHDDAIESFDRGDRGGAGLRPAADLRMRVEEPDDGPAFVALVRDALARLDPRAAARVRPAPSLAAATPEERARYLAAGDVDWDEAHRREVLANIARTGHPSHRIDPHHAFRDVRRITLRAGETLIRSGTPAGFVYLPLSPALRGRPLGGYEDFVIGPWVLVGTTGVIRGGMRNADIHAAEDMTLLVIPRAVFLSHWHVTYAPAEFAALFSGPRSVPH